MLNSICTELLLISVKTAWYKKCVVWLWSSPLVHLQTLRPAEEIMNFVWKEKKKKVSPHRSWGLPNANGVYSHPECLCWTTKWVHQNTKKGKLSVITAWLILPSSFSGKMVAILTYYSVFPKTYLTEVCWNTKKNMKTNTSFCKNFWNGEIVSRGPDAELSNGRLCYNLRHLQATNCDFLYCSISKLYMQINLL